MKNKKINSIILSFFLLVVLLLSPQKSYAESIEVKFIAEEGGFLVYNGQLTKEIKMNVDSGTTLEAVYPEVKPEDNYKFKEWKNSSQSEKEGVINGNLVQEYKASFFPDFNNNGIDDRTEKVKVNFEPNNDQKIKPIEITVGNTVELPTVTKEGEIFLGWYTNKDLTTVFDNTPIGKETTLYGKWGSLSSILNSSNVLVVRDKQVSEQIEKDLNSIYEKNTSERKNSIKESQKKVNELTDSFTQVVKVFDNINTDNSYAIKFSDQEANFLFTLVLPYGKTVETFDSNEQLISEFAVRQTSTIELDSNNLLDSGTLDYYNVETVQENSKEIVKIKPVLQNAKQSNKKIEYKEIIDLTEKSEDSNSSNDLSFIWLAVGGIVALILLTLIAASLFKKKDKNKKIN